LKSYHIQSGDRLYIPGIRAALQGDAASVPATLTQNGQERTIELQLPNLTREERDIILSGCLINYYA
jgi:aconitate hydratase